MVDKNEFYTHYCYLSGPDGMRVPEEFFDLSKSSPQRRRKFIGELLSCGRILSELPDQYRINPDRQQFEDYLNQ